MQFQPGLRSVQGVLETALSRIFEEPIRLTAAGRTDSGVHSSGQVVNFTTARSSFPFERLHLAINSALPNDVSVRDAAIVGDGFSARFSAVARSYVYAIFNRREPSALLTTSAYHVYAGLDLDAFGDAAAHLIGKHDFRSFCATAPENGNTVRTVSSLTVRRYGNLIRVQISADGFLHNMVRIAVGTLLECATGKRDAASIPTILAERTRPAAGLTAPPHGLYLAGVRYRDGYDSYCEPPLFGAV
ncbi:MAG: tRNA pseudouridine(38-40) synthase TruA [Candidatus Eremiobacteraeota bacterium]|nr:tRNA pseudouridine(38-40) synthase TruA [Candidatus Eremiobacteraeota bacterium]